MPIGKDTVDDLIEEIYPGLHDLTSMSESEIRRYFSRRVILAARNIDVDAVNNVILKRLTDDSKVYHSADSAFNDGGVANDAIPIEYLNTITVPGMPINKAQGQSLDRVGIYLKNPVFAHGQLYVALSRCTDWRNLRVLLSPNVHRKTSNIVYPEVIH